MHTAATERAFQEWIKTNPPDRRPRQAFEAGYEAGKLSMERELALLRALVQRSIELAAHTRDLSK